MSTKGFPTVCLNPGKLFSDLKQNHLELSFVPASSCASYTTTKNPIGHTVAVPCKRPLHLATMDRCILLLLRDSFHVYSVIEVRLVELGLIRIVYTCVYSSASLQHALSRSDFYTQNFLSSNNPVSRHIYPSSSSSKRSQSSPPKRRQYIKVGL